MKNKLGQQEIVGFVLIVLIVTIIGVIFLSLMITKKDNTNNVEVSNLLQSAMYYTTDCASDYKPRYRELGDIIKECYKNDQKECASQTVCSTQDSSGTKFSFNPTQGPWEDNYPTGTATSPLLVLSELKTGQEIKITGIYGNINYQNSVTSDCRNGPNEEYGSSAIGGFYDNNKKLIKEYNLRDFENSIETPSGATKLYAYIREYGQYKQWYHDNTGSCSFNLIIDIDSSNACITTPVRNVCEVMKETLKKVLDDTLVPGEINKNKAYELEVYYKTLNKNDAATEIVKLTNGQMTNCTSVEGGSHTISLGSSGAGLIEVELLVCKGSGDYKGYK